MDQNQNVATFKVMYYEEKLWGSRVVRDSDCDWRAMVGPAQRVRVVKEVTAPNGIQIKQNESEKSPPGTKTTADKLKLSPGAPRCFVALACQFMA